VTHVTVTCQSSKNSVGGLGTGTTISTLFSLFTQFLLYRPLPPTAETGFFLPLKWRSLMALLSIPS
jgi:hypothetical protein